MSAKSAALCKPFCYRRNLRTETLEARRVLAAAIADSLGLWSEANADPDPTAGTSYIRAVDYRLFDLDHNRLADQLSSAPLEFTTPPEQQPLLSIPRPDGGVDTFRFSITPLMAPELAAKFPEIQTYIGQSVSDAATHIRFDVTPAGFHAMVLSPSGSYYVDPYYHLSGERYASYFAAGEFDVSGLAAFELGNDIVHSHHRDGDTDGDLSSGNTQSGGGLPAARTGSQLRTYRLAVSATGEYTAFHGGTVPLGQAAIVTAINRVTGVYETELAIRLQLVANNDQLVFTNATTDPFTNNNAALLLSENQVTIDSRIGNANYDVGHVFSTGAGGLAGLGVVGINPFKAQGATGLTSPIGDPFFIDYVAHELGHQFGGNHTFNGDSGACTTNRNAGTAMEPGSGSTIQAYAGICGNDDLQQNSDPFFHSVSLDEIIQHVDSTIPTVGTRASTGNTVPFVSAGRGYAIPAATPFVLTAFGLDADSGDRLTYSWEQRDLGPQQDVRGGDNGSGPLFRALPPSPEPTRYFPRLAELVNNAPMVGETLPTTSRSMRFRATVRDNHLGAGGVNTDDVVVQVVNTGTPFAVTAPNTAVTWQGLSQQTLTWNVGGTTASPISTSHVSIRMSSDGGLTYPYVLANRTPNSGSATVVIPNIQTTQARFMVQGFDNIFFDISDQNATIVAAPISFALGSSSVTFTENNPPIAIAPAATVSNPTNVSLFRLSIEASLGTGAQGDDLLSILGSGTGPGQISLSGSTVHYEGTPIGTRSGSAANLRVDLNAAATTAAAQALIRHFAFQNAGDNPGSAPRQIRFVFGGGQALTTTVNVVPLNDSPSLGNTSLPTINEDTLSPAGAKILDIVGNSFADPDSGASLAAIAIVANTPNPAQGTWQYSNSGTNNWLPVGAIRGVLDSLVLGKDQWLRFVPAPNYFGSPLALRVLALDNTYGGAVSNSVTGTRVVLDPVHTVAGGAASVAAADMSINILNVNDPPIATVSQIDISTFQDASLNQTLSEFIFLDIDSSPLTWSLRSASGGQLPFWLTFDGATRTLRGTPLNRDVGNYHLILRASDQEGKFAETSVSLTVVNVNDPPEDLRLTAKRVVENETNKVVGQLFATDPDIGDQFNWTVSDSRFYIRDGLLFVGTAIDYEREQMLSLTITATDTGSPPRSTDMQADIMVTDVNEFFPDLSGGRLTVRDGAAAGTLLQTLNAPDADTFQTVQYRLKDGDASAFNLDSSTGQLRLAEPANRNSKNSYQVFVEAVDNGTPSKSRVVQFTLDVMPVNDFAPVAPATQNFSVAENSGAGTPVGLIQASDPDGNPLRFTIASTSANEAWFELDSQTGNLRLTNQAAFDFESGVQHFLDVLITEGLAPFRSTTTRVLFDVTDRNDPPTAITLSNNAVPALRMGVLVGQLQAIDQDSSSTYAFSTADPRFEIRGNQLALRNEFFFSAALAGGSTQVSITATDSSAGGVSASFPVQISVFANAPWQNLINRLDTTGDGLVSALDVAQILNALNAPGGAGPLPVPRTVAQQAEPSIDVNGDNALSPLDALLVINFLNEDGGEGESASQGASRLAEDSLAPAIAHDDLWLAAFASLEDEARKRKSCHD